MSENDVDRAISQAADALDDLVKLLRSGEDIDRIVDGYLQTRRILSATFQRIVKPTLKPARPLIESARSQVKEFMVGMFGAVIPDELLYVRAYGEIHFLLLGYLSRELGLAVPGSRLRLLSGDQVHSERRLRELRELGFRIEVVRIAGESCYRLQNLEFELERAAKTQIATNIKRATQLSAAHK